MILPIVMYISVKTNQNLSKYNYNELEIGKLEVFIFRNRCPKTDSKMNWLLRNSDVSNYLNGRNSEKSAHWKYVALRKILSV